MAATGEPYTLAARNHDLEREAASRETPMETRPQEDET